MACLQRTRHHLLSRLLSHARSFSVGLESAGEPLTSLRGRNYLVTGATDGIGKRTAALLASHGGTVLCHGRSKTRVQRTLRDLRALTGNPRIFGYCYDLASLQATRAFAQHVKEDLGSHLEGCSLDVLINNAGVFLEDMEVTADGMEATWQVNVVAPFLLAAELFDKVTERIINVSSISLADELDFDNLQQEHGYEREGHAAYASSKLALNMYTYYMVHRMQKAGLHQPTVLAVDPGTVATKLLLAGWGEIPHGVAMRAEEADDVFWAATNPAVLKASGRYYVNRKPRMSPTFSYDRQQQQRLWHLLEKQAGIEFDI